MEFRYGTVIGKPMEFRLLGTMQAVADGAEVALGPRKQRLALAVLLLEPNDLVLVSRLVEVIWPVQPPPTAHRIVHAHASRIRSLLARARTDATLTGHGPGYVLSCDPMCIDVSQFGELVARARSCRVDDQDRVVLLGRALRLWRGPPLGDTAFDSEREQLCVSLEEARMAATEELIDTQLRLGHHPEVVSELMALVTRHPDRQRLVGQLMCALHGTGRTADALNVYRQAKQRLASLFGLDPSADLQELELAILRGERSPATRIPRWCHDR